MDHEIDTGATRTQSEDHQFLVLVDEWKSANARAPRAPIYFCGRIFDVRQRQFYDFLETLFDAEAASWHASGSRETSKFLFTSTHYADVMTFLTTGPTAILDMLGTISAFESDQVKDQWQKIRAAYPIIDRVWETFDPVAIAAFRYIHFLAGYLSEVLPAGARVRIVLDQQDWLTGRTHKLHPIGNGVSAITSNDSIEVFVITDKKGDDAAVYLPLLGLVDSETWAFGRFQTLRYPDGTSVRDRLNSWRDAGRDPDRTLFDEAEFSNLIEPHRTHENLRAYWETWARWGPADRLICLAEAQSPSMKRVREIGLFAGSLSTHPKA